MSAIKTQEIITREATLRAFDEESNSAEFVISSEQVDSYNTVFRLDGWQLDSYIRNPIVGYNHRIGHEDPDVSVIGLSEVRMDGEYLVARVEFEEGNPVAEKVARKVKSGHLRMASVGAVAEQGRWGDKDRGEDPSVFYFTKHRLVEWSIVSAGSNPDAHKRNEQMVRLLTELKEEAKPTMSENTKRELKLIEQFKRLNK